MENNDDPVVASVCNHDSDNALMPVLMEFQNGVPVGMRDDTSEYCAVEYKDRSRGVLVTTEHNSYSGDIVKNEDYDSYVCVRNKITNEVHFVPVREVLLSNDIYRKLAKQQQRTLLNKDHAQKKLMKEFGGRKALRFVANREEMMVNVEVVQKELDETVKDSTVNDEADDPLANVSNTNPEYLDKLVPKFDKNAKQISEVYDVEDVVPSYLLERLEEEAKVVYSTPIESLPIKSDYLRNCIKQIQEKEAASRKDFLHIKLIIYMDALQSLIGLRKRDMRTELSHITEKVESDIRHRFADPHAVQTCARSNFSTEKAVTHFIVLALLISNKFEVDVNVLSQTLCMSRQRIITYAQIVNARPKAHSNVLSLRLPSTVPALSVARRGRRKK